MNRDRTVYSSGVGRICPDCGRPADRCACRKRSKPASSDPSDGIARVRRETSGRNGKTVTAIRGVPLPEPELRELASDLKRRCGSGGSLKDGVIEIQGDHVDGVIRALEERGLRAKRAGG